MEDKKKLRNKIVRSIFIYETKRLTIETLLKIVILILSGGAILLFGEVILDIVIENEMSELIGDFMKVKDYSYSKILELVNVVLTEIPQWLVLSYMVGLVLGCILMISVIKNRKVIFHKICSLAQYWFKL